MDSKFLLILVDPSAVYLRDLVGVKCEAVKGVKVVRTRRQAWGRLDPPLQLFFLNGDIEGFDNLEEFKRRVEDIEDLEENLRMGVSE